MDKRALKSRGGVFVVLGLVYGGLVYGCAAMEPLKTPAGNPEVTIPGVTKQESIGALTGMMQDAGYIITTVTDNRAVYYKRTYMIYSSPPMGPRSKAMPELRVIYDIVETDGGVRITATLKMLLYPERPYPYYAEDISRSKDAQKIQKRLDSLKAFLAK